jgi:hypothetical protein
LKRLKRMNKPSVSGKMRAASKKPTHKRG